MALDAATPRIVYTGNGSTSQFAVQDADANPIYFSSNSLIKVAEFDTSTEVWTTLVEGVGYSLSGGPTTGVVTRTAGNLPTGTKLVIWREEVLDQSDQFAANGNFSSTTHNGVADRNRRIDQDLSDGVSRAMKLDRALVAYDAGSKRIRGVATPTSNNDAANKAYVDSVPDAVAASASAASTSATAAASSASAASTSASSAATSAAAAAASVDLVGAQAFYTSTVANYVQPLSTVAYEHVLLDDIGTSFNGATTAFSLTFAAVEFTPASAAQLIVHVGGVYQKPGTDYTVSSTTLTFTTAPDAGLGCTILAMKTAASVVSVTPTPFWSTVLTTITAAAAARMELGSGATGDALFTAANPVAARITLGTRTSALDNIAASFDGVATAFNLTASTAAFTPRDVYGIACVYNGLLQVPGDAYTVTGSQITFTFTPQSGDSCALWAVNT